MKTTLVMALVLGLSPLAMASDVITATNAGEATYGDILWYSDPTPGHPTATYALPSSVPGLTGATGPAGADGVNGQDGAAGVNGKDGVNGVNGLNGKDAHIAAVDPRMDVEIREFDSKHWSMSSFASFGFQSDTTRYVFGQKLTLKLGKSYEAKQMELMEKRMEKLLKDSVYLPE